jgi:hypothetical protein
MDQILDQGTIRHSGTEAEPAEYRPGVIHQAWPKGGAKPRGEPKRGLCRANRPGSQARLALKP